jgi:tetratricopeptide (TPR) repeat protein
VTAFDLLGNVDDPTLEPTLLEAAEKGSDLIKPVALASYLRLTDGRAKKGEEAAARAMYHRVLELANQDEQRRQALNGLAAIPDPASLPQIKAWLNSPVREDAMVAIILIAEVLAEGKKDEALALLNEIMALHPPRNIANAAAAQLRDLGQDTSHYAREAGFVTHWWLTGPLASPDKGAWDKAFFPEQEIALDQEYDVEGQKLRWKAWVCPDVQGVTDLRAQFNPADNVAAYAYAEVMVDAAQDVDFKIGSDDDVVCWLNGEQIHANKVSRPLRVDEDVVHTRLQAGGNKILLKILQGGGQWEFCLRITDREGKPIAFTEKAE